MTSKQRAYLRGLANPIDAIFQIGKNGINDNLIKQLDDALETRELIKITTLETAPDSAKNLSFEIAEVFRLSLSGNAQTGLYAGGGFSGCRKK